MLSYRKTIMIKSRALLEKNINENYEHKKDIVQEIR